MLPMRVLKHKLRIGLLYEAENVATAIWKMQITHGSISGS